MNIDKSREAFEAWAAKHRMPLHKDGVVVTYVARCTDEAWQAWQASREAIVVELNPYINYDRELCIESIEAAGIKVKR